jgi:hypothetical protein
MTPKAFLPAVFVLVATGCIQHGHPPVSATPIPRAPILGYYPICVVDSGEIAPALVWSRSKEGVRAALQGIKSVGTYSEFTSFGVVVSASAETHREISAFWPNVGCVGETASLAGDVLVRQCQTDMKVFFSERLSIWPGPKSQVSSTCVRVELVAGEVAAPPANAPGINAPTDD